MKTVLKLYHKKLHPNKTVLFKIEVVSKFIEVFLLLKHLKQVFETTKDLRYLFGENFYLPNLSELKFSGAEKVNDVWVLNEIYLIPLSFSEN